MGRRLVCRLLKFEDGGCALVCCWFRELLLVWELLLLAGYGVDVRGGVAPSLPVPLALVVASLVLLVGLAVLMGAVASLGGFFSRAALARVMIGSRGLIALLLCSLVSEFWVHR